MYLQWHRSQCIWSSAGILFEIYFLVQNSNVLFFQKKTRMFYALQIYNLLLLVFIFVYNLLLLVRLDFYIFYLGLRTHHQTKETSPLGETELYLTNVFGKNSDIISMENIYFKACFTVIKRELRHNIVSYGNIFFKAYFTVIKKELWHNVVSYLSLWHNSDIISTGNIYFKAYFIVIKK